MSANEREAHLSPKPGKPPDGPIPERRRAPRARPTGLTYVKFEPDNGGTLVDVCESGLRFQVVAPVEDRGGIQVWFVLDPGSHIEVSGEVAWTDETKRTGGLRLTHASKQAREQLRTWLSNQHPAEAIENPISPTQPAIERKAEADEPPIVHDLEGQLRNLPITNPAPLENVLSQIMTILESRHPEDIFAKAPATPEDSAVELREAEIAETLERTRQAAEGKIEVPGGIPQAPVHSRPAPSVPAPPAHIPATIGQAARGPAGALVAKQSAQSSDWRLSEFIRSVERVRGLLSVLHSAIVSENSDWPLTEAPEYYPPAPIAQAAPAVAPPAAVKPLAAAPVMPSAPTAEVKPPAAAPSAPITIPKPSVPQPAPIAARIPAPPRPAPVLASKPAAPNPAPDGKAEIDVRPWSASAPWRAVENPAARESWLARTSNSLRQALHSAKQQHADRIFRLLAEWLDSLRDDVAVIRRDLLPKYFRAAAARFHSLRVPRVTIPRFDISRYLSPVTSRARRWVAAARSYRPPQFLRPAAMAHSAKQGLAATAGSAKRVSSAALQAVIPVQPTPSDLRIMLAITGVLLVSLAGFSYRDKIASFVSSADDAYQLHSLNVPLSSANDSAAPPANRPAAHSRAKHSSAPRVTAVNSRTTPRASAPTQTLPASSTPELRNALSYLRDNSHRDPATAAKWLWAASRKGDTSASLLLADLYLRGDGVPQSCAQARVLLLAASQKGNEEAARQLHEVDAGGCSVSGQ